MDKKTKTAEIDRRWLVSWSDEMFPSVTPPVLLRDSEIEKILTILKYAGISDVTVTEVYL